METLRSGRVHDEQPAACRVSLRPGNGLLRPATRSLLLGPKGVPFKGILKGVHKGSIIIGFYTRGLHRKNRVLGVPCYKYGTIYPILMIKARVLVSRFV